MFDLLEDLSLDLFNDTVDPQPADQPPKKLVVETKRRRGRPRTGRTPREKRTYLCPHCGKELKTVKGLNIHIRARHTGDKPYACNYCNKRFYCESLLTVHRVVHTGNKPFSCEECGKRFTQRGTLIVHKRYHSGERPFVCSLCGKAYVTKFLLKVHTQTRCPFGSGILYEDDDDDAY